MYAKIENNTIIYPFDITTMRQPGKNYGYEHDEQYLKSIGIYIVYPQPIEYDILLYKTVLEDYPIIEDDICKIYYKLVPTTDEEKQDILSSMENGGRASRLTLLRNSDWMMVPDAPWSEELKNAILTYRQELRDITKQAGWPMDIIWPTPPNL